MKLQGEFVLTEIGDDRIACSVGDSKPRVVTLNETGLFLWHLLENDCSEEELVKKLCDGFDVTPALAKSDVAAFTDYLKKHGVL